MNEYFVEIIRYIYGEKIFLKKGIVIFLGLFGCGKIMVVVYLILKLFE